MKFLVLESDQKHLKTRFGLVYAWIKFLSSEQVEIPKETLFGPFEELAILPDDNISLAVEENPTIFLALLYDFLAKPKFVDLEFADHQDLEILGADF